MAIIAYSGVDDLVKQKSSYVTWVLPTTGDTGQPLEAAGFPDKTVQAFGTAVTSITMEGSNDPRVLTDAVNAVWFPLVDPQGNAITKTAAFGEVLLESPRFIRPNLTTGTAVTVIVACRIGTF